MSSTPDRAIFYQTLCGCVSERADLLVISNKLYCPAHLKGVESKFASCLSCGQEIRYYAITTRIPNKCADCNPKLKSKQRLHEQGESCLNINQEEFLEIMMERSDCMYRPMCSEVHFKKYALPCIECPDYSPIGTIEMPMYGFDLEPLDTMIKSIFAMESIDLLTANNLEKDALEKWGDFFTKRKRDLDYIRPEFQVNQSINETSTTEAL